MAQVVALAAAMAVLLSTPHGCHGRGLPAAARNRSPVRTVPSSPSAPTGATVPAVPTVPTVPTTVPTVPAMVFDAGDPASVKISGSSLSITLTRTSTGRTRTNLRYPAGTTFSAQFKCPAGDTSGLVSSLYLSSLEGSGTQDEIDFEWLGNSKTSVQLNYYVNGVGGHEKIVALGFDCSAAFHTYTVYYGTNQITWWIDNVQVYQVVKVAGQPFPVQPVYFYQSIWDASAINGGTWAGTATWTLPSYIVQYQGFTVQ